MIKKIITLDTEAIENILAFARQSVDPAMGVVMVIMIAGFLPEERYCTLRPRGPHYFERVHAIRAAEKILENENDDYAFGTTVNLPNGQIISAIGVCNRARDQEYNREFARLIKKYAEESISA